MAEKRMFTKSIIDSDAFLEMPLSAQALYFHLNMRADDDGFVNNPKRITDYVNASADDLKILLAKRFIIRFDSGVIVIKHWRMHNTLRSDRYVAAEAVDFILSKIAKPVETDCSAFMMLCAISAGVDALKETYRKQGNSCTTYCMIRCFPATGEFELLTDRKYLTSDAYLRRGDILVSSGHTVMVLENGEKEDDDMDKATFTELFREMRKDLQDNDCSDWSEAARQWAVNNGIVQGGAPLPDGSANFMWQDMMTREQLVTVLYRFAQKLGMI